MNPERSKEEFYLKESEKGLVSKVQAECNHHFKIEHQDGEFSPGVCAHCNITRDFKNYLPETWMSGSLGAVFVDDDFVVRVNTLF